MLLLWQLTFGSCVRASVSPGCPTLKVTDRLCPPPHFTTLNPLNASAVQFLQITAAAAGIFLFIFDARLMAFSLCHHGVKTHIR